jgi:hypothetical protein
MFSVSTKPNLRELDSAFEPEFEYYPCPVQPEDAFWGEELSIYPDEYSLYVTDGLLEPYSELSTLIIP